MALNGVSRLSARSALDTEIYRAWKKRQEGGGEFPELILLAACVADSPSVFKPRLADEQVAAHHGPLPGEEAAACDKVDAEMKELSFGTGSDVLAGVKAVLEWMKGWYQWEAYIKLDPAMRASEMESLLTRIFAKYDSIKPKGASNVRIVVDVDAVQ